MQINVKDLNFRIYEEVSELESDEDRDLFPPRFIVDLCKNGGHMLHVKCKVSCYGKNKNIIFDDLLFNIYISPKQLPKPSNSIANGK